MDDDVVESSVDSEELQVAEDIEDCEKVELITESVDNSYEENEGTTQNCRLSCVIVLVISIFFPLSLLLWKLKISQNFRLIKSYRFPEVLLDYEVYSVDNFHNSSRGRAPPYWNDLLQEQEDEQTINPPPNWGPCYVPRSLPQQEKWESLILSDKGRKSDEEIEYPNYRHKNKSDEDLSGLCRPGFLIIGTGKCGTSSLYHYLVGHPRVLAAKQKQIHYFKYFTDRPMEWYLSHFPTTEYFLANGALITGEASPGYIPYPDVAKRVKSWMSLYAGDRHDPLDGHLPAIITIARDPIDRAWSSYKYSYVIPALKILRNGYHFGALKGQTNEYYIKKYLFSFEEMVAAELKNLKECLKPGGRAENLTITKYGELNWVKEEFQRRKRENLPIMLNLQMFCYGDRISKSIPRAQWKDLVNANSEKIINLPNLHLVESFLGRGLYTLPLEWWYLLHPKENLYLVCTENLKERPASTMSDLSDFLGLPAYNFTNVYEGEYNVGSHTGYDTLTSWKNESSAVNIPISKTLKQELLEFFMPYNQRLYKITGKHCDWHKTQESIEDR